MENAKKWIDLVSGALPHAVCLVVILAAVHSVYWHVEVTKEFWGIVGLAGGYLLRNSTSGKTT